MNIKRKQLGATLIGELVSVAIFGFSVLAFNELLNVSLKNTSHSSNILHANLMSEDILGRMAVRESLRLSKQYVKDQSNINCANTYTDPEDMDLKSVFCSGNAEYISDLEWSISCAPSTATTCDPDAIIQVNISWSDASSRIANRRFSFVKEAVL